MIVSMKKVTVIAVAHAREDMLHALQECGVVHISVALGTTGSSAADVVEQQRALERARQAVDNAAEKLPDAAHDAPEWTTPEACVKDILSYDDTRRAEEEKQQTLESTCAALRVWGEYDPARISALEEKGIYVRLFQCAPDDMPTLPATCHVEEIYRDKKRVSFVVVSPEEIPAECAPLPLPEKSLRAYEDELKVSREKHTAAVRALAGYTPHRGRLDAYAAVLAEEYDRAVARDVTQRYEQLVCVQGWVPEDMLSDVRTSAQNHGWGVTVEDPGDDDLPPTLLRPPRWVQPVLSVFNFIDTFPGYREFDISIVFYLFFSLFYAMLIGDAGYGIVMLAITAGVHLWKGKKIPKQPLYLLYVLNITTVIWGVLTGSYFGVEVPSHALLHDVVILDTTDFGTTVYLCFVIALIQLVIAHIWRALCAGKLIPVIGEIGNAGVVLTMFFVANTLILGRSFPAVMAVVAVLSIVLSLAGSVIGKKGEALVASIFQFPFGIINSFGDIASYIRLFAVGYATMATAQAFNQIALEIGFSHIITGFFAALILVVGHTLNMILGLLAVMVHGLRLNMLEFSTHIGQEWSGEKYKPLQRTLARDTSSA